MPFAFNKKSAIDPSEGKERKRKRDMEPASIDETTADPVATSSNRGETNTSGDATQGKKEVIRAVKKVRPTPRQGMPMPARPRERETSLLEREVVTDNANTETDAPNNTERKFSALWGRHKPGKVHVVFQEDGYLRIKGAHATLCNEEWEYLGSKTLTPENIKRFRTGYEFQVASKNSKYEVQVVDEL